MSSNIIKARKLLDEVRLLHRQADRLTVKALKLMVRASPVKRAKSKRIVITDAMRAEIHRLHDNGGMTLHQIAVQVGLRNAGRASDVINGKR